MTPELRTPTVGDILNVAVRALGPDWSVDAKLQRRVKGLAKRHVQRLRKLRQPGTRPGRVQRRHEYQVLQNKEAHLCNLILAWPSYVEPIGYDALVEMAAGLNPRRDCGEEVSIFYRPKPGGKRLIVRFGPKRRALQRLAVDVLKASHGESPFDYCRRGRGVNRAMLAMQSAVITKGARWFSTSDIKDCYGSFNREGVIAQLPLPRTVVENCLLIPPHTIIKAEGLSGASEQAARRGIPQGSLASPYIAAMLLSPVLTKLTGKLVLIHGDDVITGTRTKQECEANIHALAEACLQHPAGPLLMKHNRVAKMGSPIEALGYRMVWQPKAFGGGVRFRPSVAAFDKFYDRLEAELLEEGSLEDLLGRALEKAKYWQAGLPLWDRSTAGDDIVWSHIQLYVVPQVRTQLMKAAKVGIYA